jgi:undecaprenyl-diphosphatase
LKTAADGLSAPRAAVLGVVQGPAELLPVSSSAHLLLIPWLLRWGPSPREFAGGDGFEVALHAGGAVALLIVLRREIADELRTMESRGAGFLALSAIPPGLVGYGLERRIEATLRSPGAIAGGLAVGSIAMLAADRRPQRRGAADLTPLDGLVLGLAQAAALVPGVSRNGASLAAARWRGVTRQQAQILARSTALPIVFAATALKAMRLRARGVDARLRAPLAAGTLAAFASTLASRRLIARLDRGVPLWPYAAYRLSLAGLVVVRLARSARGNAAAGGGMWWRGR